MARRLVVAVVLRGCPRSIIHFQEPQVTFLLTYSLLVMNWSTFPTFIAISLTFGEAEVLPHVVSVRPMVSIRLSVVGLVVYSGCEYQVG